jgi:hypothetical protein
VLQNIYRKIKGEQWIKWHLEGVCAETGYSNLRHVDSRLIWRCSGEIMQVGLCTRLRLNSYLARDCFNHQKHERVILSRDWNWNLLQRWWRTATVVIRTRLRS